MSLAFPADLKGEHSGSIFFFFLIFIWLLLVLVVGHGIFSCSNWDLVLWPGIEPESLHWEHGVLATGPPGKALEASLVSPEHLSSTLTLCACAKSLHSHLTLCKPIDYSPPGSSVCGILQARILEWVATSSFRESLYIIIIRFLLS